MTDYFDEDEIEEETVDLAWLDEIDTIITSLYDLDDAHSQVHLNDAVLVINLYSQTIEVDWLDYRSRDSYIEIKSGSDYYHLYEDGNDEKQALERYRDMDASQFFELMNPENLLMRIKQGWSFDEIVEEIPLGYTLGGGEGTEDQVSSIGLIYTDENGNQVKEESFFSLEVGLMCYPQ